MRKSAVIVIIGSLFMALTVTAAQVTNVGLSYQGGATVAKIDIQGQVRFIHSTEIPKNGKPDRVIIDVLSASHQLGMKEFLNLPKCAVRSIRTSQYSVSPEKIVRIVFDMYEAPVYQVVSDDQSIALTFTGRTKAAFTDWSSASVVTKSKKTAAPARTKTIAEKNQALEEDRLVSLSGKPATKVKTAPSSKKTDATAKKEPSVKQASPSYTGLTKNFSTTDDREKASQSEESPKTKASQPVLTPTEPVQSSSDANKKVLVTKPETSSSQLAAPSVKKEKPAVTQKQSDPKTVVTQATSTPPMTTTPASKATAQKASAKQDSEKSTASKSAVVTKEAKPSTEKSVVAQKPVVSAAKTGTTTEKAALKKTSTPKSKAKLTSKSSDKDHSSQKALATKVAGDKSKDKPVTQVKAAAPDKASKSEATQPKRATSRFRRDAAQLAKIKGTMVAEFPKRLVIKYKSSGRRDPFATLIDETATYDTPIEKRTPNVEGLKLVGIIESADGANRALFEDKVGYSFILKSGDKVKKGYVLRVENDRVYFQIFEYGWSRTLALKME